MPFVSVLLASALIAPQHKYSAVTTRFREDGLTTLGANVFLSQLCLGIGARLAGSENAAKAVQWGRRTMDSLGLDNVHLTPCKVPHWVRGEIETCVAGGMNLNVCALGTSPGTGPEGVTAQVVEVQSVEDVEKLGNALKGKIVFYNRPFDAALVSTFAQYGKAGDQRFRGPSVAAKYGAVGCLVRSMTGSRDDVPHTGATRQPGIPSATLGLLSADRLSASLKRGQVEATLRLSCENMPDVDSASVVGEIRGSARPNDVIVLGGHLDSWDKGQGAHDDGAGIAQSLEALRLIKGLGIKPKRTIRVVLFMNEEISGTGSRAFAAELQASGQRAYAGIESDSGGFAPRGFSTSYKRLSGLNKWLPALSEFEAEKFTAGGGGADVAPLGELGAVLFGLQPESQRYFDYHHSDNDTIDKVNSRELELGAMSMATLAWLISEEGL